MFPRLKALNDLIDPCAAAPVIAAEVSQSAISVCFSRFFRIINDSICWVLAKKDPTGDREATGRFYHSIYSLSGCAWRIERELGIYVLIPSVTRRAEYPFGRAFLICPENNVSK